MSKVELEDIISGYNLNLINRSFAKIEYVLNNQVLFRDNPTGDANELKTDIDANSHRIYNLPFPIHESEPVRLKDLVDISAGNNIASVVSFEPYKTINSTNVQGAIQQVKDELDTLDSSVSAMGGKVGKNTEDIGKVQGQVNALKPRVDGLETAVTGLQDQIGNITMKESVLVVNNVAALKLVNPAKNEFVQTKGYYTPGDGGSGLYYFDSADKTTADNYGTVLVGLNASRWKLIHHGEVYAEQFGAKGNLTANDQPFLQSAINVLSASRGVLLLRKTYRVNSSLNYKDNTVIRGITSEVNADTVMGEAKTDRTFRTQPLICPVDGITALRNNTTKTLVGVSFERFGIAPVNRVNDDLPLYHREAVYSPDTVGIDLSYTTDARILKVMGKGLDALLFTSVSDRVCHRPVIDGIGGYSCNNFINFSSATEEYCAADILLTNISMVRMNNTSLVLDRVDGVTIADCKFFQAAYNNVRISNAGFVNISGSTFFETTLDNVYIQDCLYVVISGTIIARAGWYAWPLYSKRVTNLKIERCNIVKVDAQLERAAGYNYEFYTCGELVVNLQNYYQWISQGLRHDGLIENCFNADVNIYSTRHSDDGHATGTVLLRNSTVKGRLPGNRPWALMDGDTLDMDTANGIVLWHRLTENKPVASKSVAELVTRHFTVRPGWSARVRNISYDAGAMARLRVNTFFASQAVSADRPILETEDGATIYTNNTGIPQHIAFTMYIYNPTNDVVTYGAGLPFSASVEVGP